MSVADVTDIVVVDVVWARCHTRCQSGHRMPPWEVGSNVAVGARYRVISAVDSTIAGLSDYQTSVKK
ncbi:hypothetical protein ACFLX1_00295 [Chloroflexota bacterium]